MPLYTFIHNSLNVLVRIVNRMRLRKKEPNPSSRSMGLGFTQALTEIKGLPGGKARPERKADNLSDCLQNKGDSTSHSPIDLHGLLRG
jgi:hypothetical protein